MPHDPATPARPTPARRLLYTVLVGGYEQLTELPAVALAPFDRICFTDDPNLVSSTWQVRHVSPRFPRDPIRSSRYLKLLGPALLPDYDESLYIDNSVRLRVPPAQILDDWLATTDFGVPLHSARTTVLAEFDAVDRSGYDDPQRLYEQLLAYAAERPEVLRQQPYWNALLARRHTAAVCDAMRLWLEEVLRYSRRDGLSLNYVLARTGLATRGIAIDNHDSALHAWPVALGRQWHITHSTLADALRAASATLSGVPGAAPYRNHTLREPASVADQIAQLRDLLADLRKLPKVD